MPVLQAPSMFQVTEFTVIEGRANAWCRECWTAPISCTADPNAGWSIPLECDGGAYCCNGRWETCSTDPARPNTCFADPDEADFSNPLERVQPSLAVQIAQSVIVARVTGVLAGDAVPTALSASISTRSIAASAAINVIASSASSVFPTPTSAFTGTGSTSTGSAATAVGNGSESTDSSDASEASKSPAVQAQTPSKSSGLGTGAIAGIAVGAAAVVIILLIIAFMMYRRRKQQRRAVVAMRDQSLEDDEPQEKSFGSVQEVHPLHNVPNVPTIRSESVYSAHDDVGPPPKSSGGVSTRSLGAMSAVSALSATTPAMPVAPVSPILSPIDMTPSPIETPPSPMVTELKQGPSHLAAQHIPDRPVSPLLAAEEHHPSEGQSLVPALQPSPLQRLINGQYASNK